jgi:hypothetical protein
VPLVAVMIPFDKVQLSIFICGVHSKLSSKVYSLYALLLEVEKSLPHSGKDSGICYFTFKFDLAHLPSSCLLVAEVNAPLKIISLSRYIIITATRND